MADFCKQCSEEMFNEDFRELAGLAKPGFYANALCEGCGFTTVNHEGDCMGGCLNANHGTKQPCPGCGEMIPTPHMLKHITEEHSGNKTHHDGSE